MELKYGPYSPSRLDTGICGFAFHKQYIDPDRKRQPGSLAADRGSAIHEVFERVTKRMIAEPTYVFNEKEVRAWIVEAANNNPASYQATEELLEMVHKYIRIPPPVLVEDAEVELKLAVKHDGKDFVQCDYDDPEAFARGRADILMISDDTTHALIYDHKTQPNVEEADTFQMGIYAWVISKIYPFLDEVRTVLHFARYGKYSEPYIWNKDDLARIEDELITRISIIEGRTEWVATPHGKCQYCPFMSECPAISEYININQKTGEITANYRDFKILGDTNKAVKMAGLLNVIEEITKEVRKELRNHIKLSESPIAIPGKIFEFRADTKIHWDKVNKALRDDTYAVFEKYNMDPRDFMGFSQTFSTGVWRTGNEALVKELSELFPRKNEATFKGYKS